MKATVDRIGNGIAVLITGEAEPATITLPERLLPEGCREGDVVTIGIARDDRETAAAQDRISALIDRLKNRE